MSISKTTCESAIARTIRALSPVCGKTFSVKDTSDPFYGVYEYTITATGKDMSAHVLPYLSDMRMFDYDEDYWVKKFGESVPHLKPRKRYVIQIHDTFCYRFKQGMVVDGYLL